MPRQRPTSVTVIAILHFVFGGLGFLCVLCAGGGQLAGAGKSFMPKANTPEAKEQEKLQEEIQQKLEQKLPYSKEIGWGTTGIDLVLCVLMIAGGVGLLQLQSWGRLLSIVYALLSLLLKIFNFTYSLAFTVPVTKEIIREAVKRQEAVKPLPEEAKMIFGWMETAISVTPWVYVLFAIYPLIVLIIMFRPKVVAAFRGESMSMAPLVEDYDDRYPQGRIAPPPDERFTGGDR